LFFCACGNGAGASKATRLTNDAIGRGRRYHAYRDGLYAFPNDDLEQNRDDIKHDMWMLLSDQKLFYAPLEEKLEDGDAEVLDLGTGTGSWCIASKSAHGENTGHE
jgi:hypothetical protein